MRWGGVLLTFFAACSALNHTLELTNDGRTYFFIENFGFEAGGVLEISLQKFLINNAPVSAENKANKFDFVVKRSETDSNIFAGSSIDHSETDGNCIPDPSSDQVWGIKIYETQSDLSNFSYSYRIKPGEEGFYNVYFISCDTTSVVSFKLILVQYNIDQEGNRNYLSSGLSSLPTIYAVFTSAYFGCFVFWVFYFLRRKDSKVNRLHYLMSLLLILKFLSLLFKTIEYHKLKYYGIPEGWNIPYYIFSVMKGIMLFTLLAFMGTGWTFIKPFLSERDKRIILVVIPLQILDNIAMIILEETAPGSQAWETWKDIFRLVDLICCGAVLIPIIWSIKHLKEASQSDGKAARNMQKLQLFQQFYMLTISYIYFTRIVVYLVEATLPFRFVWLGDFFTEAATLIYFSVAGYKFRPVPDNPYFALDHSDPDSNNQSTSNVVQLDTLISSEEKA